MFAFCLYREPVYSKLLILFFLFSSTLSWYAIPYLWCKRWVSTQPAAEGAFWHLLTHTGDRTPELFLVPLER